MSLQLSPLLYMLVLIAQGCAFSYDDEVTCASNREPTMQGRYGRCIPYRASPPERPNSCDVFYTPDVDHFYIPNDRALGDTLLLNNLVAQGEIAINVAQDPCRETAIRLFCYHYYPPCQTLNKTHFLPPASYCKDTCNFSLSVVCEREWMQALEFISSIQIQLDLYNVHFPNCSAPSRPLEPLGDSCCSDVGIQVGVVLSFESSNYTVYEEDNFVEVCIQLVKGIVRRSIPVTLQTHSMSADDPLDFVQIEKAERIFAPNVTKHCINVTILEDNIYEGEIETFGVILFSTDPVVSYRIQNTTISIQSLDPFVEPVPVVTIAASVTAGIVLLILLVAVVVAIVVWRKVRKLRTPLKIVIEDPGIRLGEDIGREGALSPTQRYMNQFGQQGFLNSVMQTPREQRLARVASGFLRHMSEEKLLIPAHSIKLLDCIGQGEFGIVYRAHLSSYKGRSEPGLVAVKTLKVVHNMKDLNDLCEECLKMARFNHRNVLSLTGVCIDAAEAPYLVMPFMELGSLLSYLRKKRAQLTVTEKAGDDLITETQRKLLSMCLQIASGMAYLAQNKFIHRDLAARNCMIDSNYVIKVSDFGLSEDIYVRNYFRQTEMSGTSIESGDKSGSGGVKLPVRWMALESLHDGVFTEKTDVWSFGVTCWEVFSLGRKPYPAVDPFALIKFLEQGGRLDKPANAACSDEVFELIQSCWLQSPDKRSSFEDLKQSITTILESISGYLDFSAVTIEDKNKGSYNDLKQYDRLEPCNELPHN